MNTNSSPAVATAPSVATRRARRKRGVPHGALVGLALLAACAPGTNAARGRDVLVLVADSVHAEHLSCHGYERATTPHLDRLAAEGLRFANAHSQSAWTLPSVASLFTSLEQEEHGVERLEDVLGEAPSTLAELFRDAGYRTAAVVQTPVLAALHRLDRGFDTYEVLDWKPGQLPRALELVRAAVLGDGDGASGERPRFTYAHLIPPHMPYQPPPPWRGRFAADDDPERDGSIEACRRVHRGALPPEHPDVVRLAAQYDEHLAWLDAQVGALLDALRALPPAERPIVLFTSDHGEAFMQHGAQGHNGTVFQEMLHVPLVLWGPDARLAPRVDARVASLLDVLPTLVELCGLPPPRHAPRGRSLFSGDTPRTLRFSAREYAGEHPQPVAVRRGRWKWVRPGPDAAPLLFDLQADPGEQRPLGATQRAAQAALLAELESWRAERAPRAPRPDDSELRYEY